MTKIYRVHIAGHLDIDTESQEKAEILANEQIVVEGLHLAVTRTAILPFAPERWEVGMLIEYITDQEWSWRIGTRGRINSLGDLCNRPGSEYQVFWVHPIGKDGKLDTKCTWWTTPNDVSYLGE